MEPKFVVHINYSVADLYRILELALKQVIQENPTNYYTISRLSTDLDSLNYDYDELCVIISDADKESRL